MFSTDPNANIPTFQHTSTCVRLPLTAKYVECGKLMFIYLFDFGFCETFLYINEKIVLLFPYSIQFLYSEVSRKLTGQERFGRK